MGNLKSKQILTNNKVERKKNEQQTASLQSSPPQTPGLTTEEIKEQQTASLQSSPPQVPEQTPEQKINTTDPSHLHKTIPDKVNNLCTICQENMNIDTIEYTTCLHSFHATCIEKWLKQHSSCPLCRYELKSNNNNNYNNNNINQNPANGLPLPPLRSYYEGTVSLLTSSSYTDRYLSLSNYGQRPTVNDPYIQPNIVNYEFRYAPFNPHLYRGDRNNIQSTSNIRGISNIHGLGQVHRTRDNLGFQRFHN